MSNDCYLCSVCGTAFTPKWVKKARPPKYCSKACSDLGQQRRVSLICTQCDRPFEVAASRALRSIERGSFCGMKCYGEWQRDHTRGAAAPAFKPEQQITRASLTWKQARKAALKRDDYRCTGCGMKKSHLHVHHVRAFDPGDPHTHDLDNLQTLCNSCHTSVHNANRKGGR